LAQAILAQAVLAQIEQQSVASWTSGLCTF